MTNDFKPAKAGGNQPRLSKEEYAEKKRAEKEKVYQMIDDAAREIVSDPEKFKNFLDTQSRMDRYSAANALLIYSQYPQATQLKDFDDWGKDNVKITKGAKSISNSRVEWCACFVSWCADQCGYIENGLVPKFAGCVDGANWFKSNGKWQDRTYEPKVGDIIFFDWEGDGTTDHVGIVEKCENGTVYTVEGNSGDACKQRQYAVGSSNIYGYGIPAY